MMSNYALTECSMSKLTCFNCKKPLSHFPIYNSEAGPSCGRCEAPPNGSRNEIFEEIAKNVEFPCGNNQNGCLEILLPKNVTNHELHCKFQTFTCPFNCPNEWKGFAHDFLEHTKKEHPTSLLSDCCFEVDFKNTHKEIKLMPYLDGLYLIKYHCSKDQKILWCTLTQFGYEPVKNNLNYQITFEDGEKQFNYSVRSGLNARVSIHKYLLDNLLRNPSAVLASVEVFQNQPANGSVTKNADAELLKHFECIVCMDYLIGPIYQCVQGHIICQTCRDRVTACSTCKSQIQTTRNYTLESVISDTEFPCKYDKCLFVGKGTVIKKHQETCNFIERDCPLKELYGCEEKFLYADLSDHICKEHNEHCYKGDVISHSLTFDEKYERVFFLKYCSKLFRLTFSYRNDLFTFVAKLMDSSEESFKYCFVVDILDATTENKNRLRCSKILKSYEQTIQIHVASIEHLLILFSFSFRMLILEN